MLSNARPTEINPLLACIAPASVASGATVTSGWVSLAEVLTLQAVINAGVFGAGGTVDAKIQQATSATGTGAKDITGKAITQLVAAGGNNRQAIINLRSSDLDCDNNYAFVQVSITVGGAAVLLSASVIAGAVRYMAKSTMLSSIAQVVS